MQTTDSSSPSRFSRDGESITALASAPGAAGVAVIRISGNDLPQQLRGFFRTKRPLSPRQATYCEVIDPHSSEKLDDAIVIWFAAPGSFTGEDVIEIQCHGGPYIVQRILKALHARGIREADPGEFTKRAFLNGRLDLTEAEGIKELVEAQSHQQWLAARQLSSGRLSTAIEELRTRLIQAMALLEAQIDFPDEGDTAHLAIKQVQTAVQSVHDQVGQLRKTYDNGRVATEGLSVALIGEPNAGKSTLLNTLLDKDRAIVTDIAGTTRDYLEETCLINGRYVRLLDTAGIHDRPDAVEAIGVASSREWAAKADIVLFLAPANGPGPQPTEDLIRELSPKNVLRIRTKADLKEEDWGSDWITISSHTGKGIADLRQAIADAVDAYIKPIEDHTFITSARHRDALDRTLASLAKFFIALEQEEYEEMLAFELREARDHLQSIVGEIGTEDVLDNIFSSFCIGK